MITAFGATNMAASGVVQSHICSVPMCSPVSSRRSAFMAGQPFQKSRSGCQQAQGRRAVQVCAKGKGRLRSGYQQQTASAAPPTPEPDPQNVEFVLFVRSTALPRWLPVSIMNGQGAANTLVRSLDSPWGRKLFSNTLIRNIAQSLYKDKQKLDKQCRTNYQELKTAPDLQYGFKIRDKSNPKNWYVPKDVTLIPPPFQVNGTPLDNARAFFATIGK